MEFRNMPFEEGQKLKFRVKPSSDCNTFSINIGQDADNIALHFNPRFDHQGCVNVIVLNHLSGGTNWGEEQKDSYFPFTPGKAFKFYVTFTKEVFTIMFSDDYTISFPNHLKEAKYDYLHVVGSVELIGIKFS